MITRLFKLAVLIFLLQSCAASEPGIDSNHEASTGEQSDSGKVRGFDPCKLNNTLPVCS